MEKELDYAKLWRTLMRTGINQRFSQIRSEFFMKIATDGVREFSGEDAIKKIIDDSECLSNIQIFKDLLGLAISPEDEFKYYSYFSDNGTDFNIEYFANLNKGIPRELIDYAVKQGASLDVDGTGPDYEVDGYCQSLCFAKKNNDEDDENDSEELTPNRIRTVHFILIGEGGDTITPETYPSVIKHELTHACLFELRELINVGYYDTCKIPATWTDDEIIQWRNDVLELRDVMESNDPECASFSEFVGDFLMYESDGQTKEKNPVVESRTPRTTKADAKPKITYRTLTPLDRFEERLDIVSPKLHDSFQEIINALRPLYDKYDEFLDSIKM